ncbi:MAG: pentapeptide repeat-containing protein [Alphaproteobacteria bacterium]
MNDAQNLSPDDVEYIVPGPEPTQDELLALAGEGAKAWNAWRERYPVLIDKESQQPNGPRADFSGVYFTKDKNEVINFSGFNFGHGASFIDTQFGDNANFHGAIFGNDAQFKCAKFGDGADFGDATFGDNALFDGASFGVSISFYRATFGEGANFEGAAFGDGSVFLNATFGDRAWFSGRAEKEDAFSSVSFTGARFLGYASFARRVFNASADFDNTSFKQPPEFSAIKNPENLNWTAMKVGFAGAVGGFPTPGWTTKTETVTRLQRLRRIAANIHANDAERDLFIAERKAERGFLWKAWWRRKRDLSVFTKALRNTLLLFLYSLSSNCGRSVLLPLFWLAVSSVGFWGAYDALAVEGDPLPVGDSGESIGRTRALLAFTGSRFLPLLGSSFAAAEDVESALFAGPIPSETVQALAAGQGILNAILLFLLALALRNHFRVG